jgi:hypothetical protein
MTLYFVNPHSATFLQPPELHTGSVFRAVSAFPGLTDMAVAIPNNETAISVFPHPRSPSPDGRGVRYGATRVSR